jgi:Holliday junction resolvase
MKPVKLKEAWVKSEVKKIFKKHGIWFFMPAMGTYGTSGIPDFIACLGGLFLAVEAKVASNKPTELQALQIGRINYAGGIAVIVNENRLDALNAYIEETRSAKPLSPLALTILCYP